MKHLRRTVTLSLTAALGLTLLAPGAEARYPPTIPARDCIRTVPSRIHVGEDLRVRGAKGCAMRPRSGDLTQVRLIIWKGDIKQERIKQPRGNGSYVIGRTITHNSPEGRTRVIIQTGGERYVRFTRIIHPTPPPPPATTFPDLSELFRLLALLFQQFGLADAEQASAQIETPSLAGPVLGSLAVLGIGGWFVFAPPRRRRRFHRRTPSKH